MFNTSTVSKAVTTAGVVAAFTAAMIPSLARADEVQDRIQRQNARINQGVRSGQLTQGEYRRDDARLDRIEAQRRRDLRNGPLTSAEEKRLNRELNRNSDGIHFTKHNRADQPGV